MKITLENTSTIVELETPSGERIPGRIWEGHTDTGIFVQCVITRIAAPKSEDLSQFERELKEQAPPKIGNAFPLRMVI